MTRAGLYIRVSTDQQSHDLQFDELRRVAAQRGYGRVEYVDTESGASSGLAARKRLLQDAKTGKLDVVMVWRLDRFGRVLRELLDAVDSFQSWGVEFVSLRDNIDTTTPAGRLTFHIMGALAEFERGLISERVQAGLEAAKRRGTKLGRPRREIDLVRARSLIEAGGTLKGTARELCVPPRTLRRALQRGQKPSENDTPEVAEIMCGDGPLEEGAKTDEFAP